LLQCSDEVGETAAASAPWMVVVPVAMSAAIATHGNPMIRMLSTSVPVREEPPVISTIR